MKTLRTGSAKISVLSALVLGSALLSACGGSSVNGLDPQGSQNHSWDLESSENGSSSSGTYRTGIAPYQFTIRGTGYSTETITVKTRRILKVKFTPGKQNTTQSGTGYTWNYTILGVFIGVSSETRATPPLFNGFPNGKVESTQVMDYSTSFRKTCSDSEGTSCRQQITVVISKPNSDDACINLGAYCPSGYTRVPDNHPWNGTLTVETDDTDGI